MQIRLSKSRLLAFRQCPKRLWLEVHKPELKTVEIAEQRRFDTGNLVGDLARKQFPEGYLIAPDNNLGFALRETQDCIRSKEPQVLFEATFEFAGILIRADLLIPNRDGWQIVEVKSSTSVKPQHLEDAAVQLWVVKNSGLPTNGCSVQVIDSAWTYSGQGNYAGLFRSEPVDEQLQPLLSEVPTWLASAMAVANGAEPEVAVGHHCTDPYPCGFMNHCASTVAPVEFPISWLPRIHHTKVARYEAAGFTDMRHLPIGDLSEKQRRVYEATLNNQTFLDPLSEQEKALFTGTKYYLDFETINFAVPIWAGTRPYQQIPFQWSCHIETDDGSLQHEMFLDLGGEDPSRKFAETLLATLGQSGPIVVYNQAFEKRIIWELADRFSDLSEALTALPNRIVDLLPITRNHFYDPSMQGSWSIKSVLPAIAPDLNYADLGEVGDGLAAQAAYLEAIAVTTTSSRKEELETALRNYCAQDTHAMIIVLRFLLAA